MTEPTLYLLIGYPGAGKTTTAKLIADLTGAMRLSSDEIRLQLFKKPEFSQSEHQQLYAYLNEKCELLLKEGKGVIYDANLNRYEHRQEKYAIARKLGAKTILIWVKTPKPVAKERATHKDRSRYIPLHETASAMFERIADIIESPKSHETAVIIDGTHITRQAVEDAIK